ncbi:MAG: sigma-54-dependent Fis family transcriptional regulator [Leptolyngbya sp. SIO3F4]|nr:sigma-54-dependent Fis family transcriptional regulator [Leptolyngbya sp. SIO3F4]
MKQGDQLRVFIVEDDEWYSDFLEYNLKLNEDNLVRKFHTGKEFLKNLHEQPDVVTLDYSLPDMDGAKVLQKIKDFNRDIQVLIISGQEDISTAVELLKLGAYDYIVKNEETRDRLFNILNNVRNTKEMREEISQLKEEIGRKYDFSKAIVGSSTAIKRIFSLIEKACKSKITVSITGETGTGKELVAKAIHYNSHKRNKPFVPVNVSAIPKDLIESELFGHEKGAFTGATQRRIGKFEEASGGTLFLDEIGEMDINLQAKLLRVLQERELTRIGGNKNVSIDVRVICATHRNLADEVKNGTFREDLYYRLLGLPIHLPPLRERGNDIVLIANHFVKEYSKENGVSMIHLSSAAKNKLLKYHWPGNVRELKAVVELACVMAEEDVIEEDNIIFNSSNSLQDILLKELTLKEYTRRIIKTYLDKYNNNVLEVARKLDVGKSTIYRMLQNNELE